MTIYTQEISETGELALFELDDTFYCLRAIYVKQPFIFNTNLTVEHASYFLPEGCFADALDEIEQISKDKFLYYWHLSISPHLKDWQKLKEKFKIGQFIKTYIVCFYPQGVIVQFGEKFYGLANDHECLCVLGAQKMYSNTTIELCIDKFDDENLWVIFSTPASFKH